MRDLTASSLLSDGLTARLEEELEHLPARAAVFLQPLGEGESWAHLPDEPFPAASLMKLPLLLEVYRRFQEGLEDPETPVTLRPEDVVGGAGILLELHPGLSLTLRDLARLMIVVSDNTASNMLLDRVGFPAVRELLARLGMGGTSLNRRFMETPGPQGDNVTTARDCIRVLEALWSGRVLAEPWREEALNILRRQQFRERIPMRLPVTAVVANKTGELEGVRHDAALVEDRGKAFLLAVLTREGREPWEVDSRVSRIARWCYDHVMEGSLEEA